MFSLVLVEAALETVPREISFHPSVVHSAMRFGVEPAEMLLDVSFHYAAMKGLENRWKRGRPDIIHAALLECMGSPSSRSGVVTTAVHTFGNVAITVNPRARLPRNYMRFVGLFGKLLPEGEIRTSSNTETLLEARPSSLKDFIHSQGGSRVILLSEGGKMMRLMDLARQIVDKKDVTLMVGGFPHGDFEPSTLSLTDDVVSIYPQPLATGVVVARILAGCEIAEGLL